MTADGIVAARRLALETFRVAIDELVSRHLLTLPMTAAAAATAAAAVAAPLAPATPSSSGGAGGGVGVAGGGIHGCGDGSGGSSSGRATEEELQAASVFGLMAAAAASQVLAGFASLQPRDAGGFEVSRSIQARLKKCVCFVCVCVCMCARACACGDGDANRSVT